VNINDACDYIIVKLKAAGESLNVLKLQKLLYYSQAWHLALHGDRLFDGRFQAWVHGPVSRQIYDRFAVSKSLHSEVSESDVAPDFDMGQISNEHRSHLDDVLGAYAKYRGSQLEEMTHDESPWVEARKGYRPSERCEREMSEETMRRYYVARLI
jgi:uncharacterized phage-associated protein